MWWRRKRSRDIIDRFGRATRARIIEGGVSDGKALGDRVALELDGGSVRELVDKLQVVESEPDFHCMCLGDWGIELYRSRRHLGTIGLHHGLSIRLDSWISDATLIDGPGLLEFLAGHGLGEPLAAYLDDRERATEAASARTRWLEAVPAVLEPDLAQLEAHLVQWPKPNEALATEVLTKLEHDRGGPVESAAALLGWYAAATGPWSGYPSYEAVVEQLLVVLGAELVARAAEAASDPPVLFAAARFFARHDAPPKQRRLVSSELLDRLRAATEALGDDDARSRLSSFARRLEVPAAGPTIARAENTRDVGPVIALEGESVITIDGPELVVLRRGERRVLDEGMERGAVIAGGSARVVVSRGRELIAVDPETGASALLATAEGTIVDVATKGERTAWIENRDGLHVVRELGRPRAWAEESARTCDLHLVSPSPDSPPIWGRVLDNATRIVTLSARGRTMKLAELPGDERYVTPRFRVDERRIAVRTGQDVTVIERGSGARRRLGLARGVEAVALDGDVLWLIALAPDRWSAELLRLDLVSGEQRSCVSYRRALYHREDLSIGDSHVAWNSGGSAMCVPRV